MSRADLGARAPGSAPADAPTADRGADLVAPRRAAALAYTARDVAAQAAPRVIAKGERLLADEIIARAHAAGIPVHQSRELVALLMQVDLDAHIPPALYLAVAEVLAWAYRLERAAAGAATAAGAAVARAHGQPFDRLPDALAGVHTDTAGT